MQPFRGISHLLLDIEGTTCPVHFVAETLFPFAAAQLPSYVQEHERDPDVIRLLNAVQEAWLRDADPEAVALLQQDRASEGLVLVPYLQLLIRQDRKLPALKDLQGLIWKAGYASGELLAPLFDDVAEALHRWHGSGVVLAAIPRDQCLRSSCSMGTAAAAICAHCSATGLTAARGRSRRAEATGTSPMPWGSIRQPCCSSATPCRSARLPVAAGWPCCSATGPAIPSGIRVSLKRSAITAPC